MSLTSKSCRVSSLSTGNHATVTSKRETLAATPMQPEDLLALSRRVLERNKSNIASNSAATNQVQEQVTNHSYECFQVASCKEDNDLTKKLRWLIKIISDQYGGDDPTFLNHYTNEIIQTWSFNLTKALACFEQLFNHNIGTGKGDFQG